MELEGDTFARVNPRFGQAILSTTPETEVSTKESLGNTFVHGFRSSLSLVATAFKFRKRKKTSP